MANRLAGETSPYLLQHAENPVDWYAVGRGGVRPRPRGGPRGARLDRLLRLPLVPRDGARELRGRGDRAADERALRLHQGRPRGAPRRRRDLHGRDAGDDRRRRLAAERLPHPRRRAVLVRHLLPARAAPGHAELAQRADRDRRGVGRAARGDPRAGRRDRRAPARRGGAEAAGGGGRPRLARRRGRRRCASSTTPSTAASAARPSSRPPPRSSSCSGAASARWRCTRCAGWRAAACTTRSAAASRATRSTAPGSSRTSRRCSTTTRCWPARTSTPGRSPASRCSSAWPARRSTGRWPSCARRRARSPPRSTPTPRASRASSTSGRPPQVREVLGDELADEAIEHFGMTEQGNFEGANIPVRAKPDPPHRDELRTRLYEARAQRVWPGLDDKRLTGWNALMISALADAASAFDDDDVPRRRGALRRLPRHPHARRGRPPAAHLQPRPGAAARGARGPRVPARGADRRSTRRRSTRAGSPRRARSPTRSSSASPTPRTAASSRPPTTTSS